MEIIIDPDVKAVAEFMQARIEARKLVGVAEGLRAVAPLLWGRYQQEPITAMALEPEDILTCGSRPTASELPPARKCAGDGSEAVAVGP